MYIGQDELGNDVLLGEDEILGQDLDALLGDDEILGNDVLLGADSPRKRALARRIALKRAHVVRAKTPEAVQTQALPFPPTLVAAGAIATINAFPQRTFRTERFAVASSIAAFFVINDLTIGRESMFVAEGGMPAQVFSEVGVGVRLMGYTANLGHTVTLVVQNIDVAAQTFRGAIIGATVVNP